MPGGHHFGQRAAAVAFVCVVRVSVVEDETFFKDTLGDVIGEVARGNEGLGGGAGFSIGECGKIVEQVLSLLLPAVGQRIRGQTRR